MRLWQLSDYGMTAKPNLNSDNKAKFLNYAIENGSELWSVFKNLYVITRYDHSASYGMAVYQLSQEILKYYQSRLSLNGQY